MRFPIRVATRANKRLERTAEKRGRSAAGRSALKHVLNKRSWLAAFVGTTIGAGALYLLQSIPLIALIPFPFAGIVSVACYGFALRQPVSIAAGVVLGLQTGILMSVLVIIWTIIITGVGHYEFAGGCLLRAVHHLYPVYLGRRGNSLLRSKACVIAAPNKALQLTAR